MAPERNVYGYVNGEATYSREEFIYKSRGFGPIQTDEELLAFAYKASRAWYNAGWHRTFTTYYLGNYALSEPYASLTNLEYERLKQLQKEAQEKEEKEELEKEWRLVETCCYADNSVEEIYENKYGEHKNVMAVYPHGD
ncbi:MAG: hypothetical protein LUD12_10060 [Lachnospiraceae bacterium]|nr:hypothetical protein [Lachnospiraceae bacterium]